MSVRLLLTSAGSGTTNNLVRSLRAADPTFTLVGSHDDRFVLKNSTADVNVLLPPPDTRAHAASLETVIRRHRIDLAIPSSERDVTVLARLRRRLSCRTFLPSASALARCGDKYALARHLEAHGVPVATTYVVPDLRSVPSLVRRLRPHGTLWCRIRTGAGSMGATPVRSAGHAVGWIRYWHEMRGVPPSDFTLSEYLPGRDYACQSLWSDGRPVLVKTAERLSYFEGWSRPSGVSSVAALARTVVAPDVADVSVRAVQSLGPRVRGAFSVDLKENAAGVPCVTEINAGRFITMLNLFDFTGKHNMTAAYVRLALGEPLEIAEPYDAVEDHFLVRDVDRTPGVFHADELFEGLEDARDGGARPRTGRTRGERRARWER